MKRLVLSAGLALPLAFGALLPHPGRQSTCAAQTPRTATTANTGGQTPPPAAQPQGDEDQEESRKLWDEELLQKRRRDERPARRNYRYRRVTPRVRPAAKQAAGQASAAPAAADRVIGLTFWRLRPSTGKDETRLLVQKPGGGRVEYTPERIAAGTPLEKGQLVRISVESPVDGYLYVFDRERYADGKLGPPYLIFPTSRTRGGNNEIRAGNVVEIPAQDEPPFEVAPTDPNVVGETLTIIVSPRRLGLPLSESLYELSAEQRAQFDEWEKKWAGPFEVHEQSGGVGVAYTASELKAGKGEAALTQADPLPQTIYRVPGKPGAPFLLLSVPLNYAPAR